MKEELFKLAKERMLSFGVDDGACQLSRMNGQYGLAKMLWTQEKIGEEKTACFISTPDETITRNTKRFLAGVSYGGAYMWGSDSDKIVFPDIYVNSCGMLTAGIQEKPELNNLLEKLSELFKKESYIGEYKLNWDLWKSNHFLDIFKVTKKDPEFNFPYNYALVIHMGCSELASLKHKGLAINANWENMEDQDIKVFETPWGKWPTLLGEKAVNYLELAQFANDFADERRKILVEALFEKEEMKICYNAPHQSLRTMNRAYLGAHDLKDAKKEEAIPFMLNAEETCYLFEKRENIKIDLLDSKMQERVFEQGIEKKLGSLNFLPHGGGYAFGEKMWPEKVISSPDGTRLFSMKIKKSNAEFLISQARELPFFYRGKEVYDKTVELKLGKPVVDLFPELVIKL
ncbi:MAG: hypothetical protein KAR35_08845 [Candidatus Heimdallarchaeota archaeon]|nr:hypothetical protein [Candidatus Heimdallarchaeota archaeon]MCK5049463.1 hypothetical protein [Candidatus Heimdallarchaeota archaeon]